MPKCERCGGEVKYVPYLPDALDTYIRSTQDIEELRRLLIIRTDRLTTLKGQVEILRSVLEARLDA